MLFIQSQAELSDDIHVADILAHFGTPTEGSGTSRQYLPFTVLLQIVDALRLITPGANQQLTAADAQSLAGAKTLINSSPQKLLAGRLEADLFRVLGIQAAAIEFLAGLDDADRSYAESLVETWNEEIDKTLNLSHYWQQDDQFRIRMNYKRGMVFFPKSRTRRTRSTLFKSAVLD